MSDLTLVLRRIEQGDARAADELLPLVYHELRKLAAARMRGESAAQTLQPTALVHEAWLRLGGENQPAWENRGHFFAAAAEAMRRILIDRARRRQAVRHGGGLERAELDEARLPADSAPAGLRLLALNEALEKFSATEPRKAELVKLRYFAGLTLEQVSAAMNIPLGTAKRWWTYSRAWLYREIQGA